MPVDPGVLGLAGLAVMRRLGTDPEGVAAVIDRYRALAGGVDPPAPAPPVPQASAVVGVVEGYTTGAATYDTRPNPMIDLEGPVVDGFLEHLPPGRALDAACGTGRHCLRLRAAGWEVTGVDRTDAMLRVARSRSDTPLVHGDLIDLPFADGGFDLVICALALTHLPDLDVPIREFARVVRPGGHLVLTDLHPVACATGANISFEASDGTRRIVQDHIRWHQEYLASFRAAGLVVQDCVEPEFHVSGAAAGGVAELAELAVGGLPGILAWLLRRPS